MRIADATIRPAAPRRARTSRRRSCRAGLRVVLDDAAVTRLVIVSPTGTEVRFDDIRGSATIAKIAHRLRRRTREVARLGGRGRERKPVRTPAARARGQYGLVAVGGESRGGHRSRGRRPRSPARGRAGRRAGHRARACGSPRPRPRSRVPGRGRDREARPRAVDGRPAARSLAGHARDRRRSLALRRPGEGARPRPARTRRQARCAHELRRPGAHVRVDRAGVGSRLRRPRAGHVGGRERTVLRHDGRLDRFSLAARRSRAAHFVARASRRPTAGPNSTIASAATSSRPARRPSPAKPPATSRPARSSSTNRTGRPSAAASRSRARWAAMRPRPGPCQAARRTSIPRRSARSCRDGSAFDFAGEGAGFDAKGPWSATIQKLSGVFRGQRASGGGARQPQGRTRPMFQDVAFALGPGAVRERTASSAAARTSTRASSRMTCPPSCRNSAAGWMRSCNVREHTVALGFTGHDLVYGSHRAVVLSADAHVDRDGREHSWLRLRSNGITLAGFPITDTRLSLDGLPSDHTLTFRIGAGAGRRVGSWPRRLGRGPLHARASTTSPPAAPASCPGGCRPRRGLPRAPRTRRSIRSASFTRRAASASRGAGNPPATGRSRPTTEAFPLEALDSKRLGRPAFPRHSRLRRRGVRTCRRALDRQCPRRDPGRRAHLQVLERRGPHGRARTHPRDARLRCRASSARPSRERRRRPRPRRESRGRCASPAPASATCRSAEA